VKIDARPRKRAIHLSIVVALASSLLSIAASPATATAPPEYSVGDTGPGGGTIFYYSADGFACGPNHTETASATGGKCKYLEVAPSGWYSISGDPSLKWANGTDASTDLVGVANDGSAYNNVLGVGLGYKNSIAIVNQSNDTTTAAGVARAYAGGSLSDWYLPNTTELNLLSQWNRGVTQNVLAVVTGGAVNSSTFGASSAGIVDTHPYHASSESNGSNSWGANINSGSLQGAGPKTTSARVRPIRAFGDAPLSTDATLSALTISSGTLSPTFVSSTVSYTASVTNATSSITVTPTRNQVNATIQVRVNSGTYTSVTSGSPSGSLSLSVGSNTVNVLVTAQNGSTTATYTITLTRAAPPEYSVGDTGPGGGKIFYYSADGFACGPSHTETGSATSGKCKWLEAAPSTWNAGGDPQKPWADPNSNNYNYEIPGVTIAGDPPPLTATDIGLGYKDSLAILRNGRGDTTTAAAYAARTYSGGSKSDWYLPSPVELNLLCQWARGVTSSATTACTGGTLNSATYGAGSAGFQGDFYWSSTQASGYPSYAYSRHFGTGNSYSALKNSTTGVRVRPIRAFGDAPLSTDATLSALTISSGTLSPTFLSSTDSYTASVTNATSSITVTPTRNQANATIQVRVNSGTYTSVTSGSPSGSLSLSVGSNTVNVLVTAQNGSTTATYTITVTRAAPAPSISISTTTFTPGTTSNVGVTLSGFNETQSYQVTIKFVNTLTNLDVTNGTLVATQGSTSTISGYTSYSGTKLGFKGTYAAISAALSSLTWNPTLSSGGTSIRIGIASMVGDTEFYDANSGRYYKFVSTPTPWRTARTAAEATYLFGLQGYLAEINSAAENAFIANETNASNVWIGASEDETTTATFTGTSYNGSIGQRWIWNGAVQNPLPVGSGLIAQSGLAAYSSWSGGEPNNDLKPGEDCAVTNWRSKGLWNDLPCVNSNSYLMEFGGRPNETSTAITSTLTTTVTAVGPSVLTVRYDRNGAPPPGLPERESDSYLPSRGPITLPGVGTMSRAGFTFTGWSLTGRAPALTSPYTPPTNITLKAIWTAVEYTITYNANGGNTTPTQASRVIGQRFNLAGPITRDTSGGISYQFAGWNSGSSIFKAGETITVGTSNLAYSAAWIQQYEVTYLANGGTFAESDTEKESECGGDLICAANDTITVNSAPTREGYTFAGWLDQNGTLVSDLDSGTPGIQTTVTTTRYILAASWTAVDYTITYVSSGSTAPTQSPLNIGQTFTVGAAVTRDNFRFNGWSDGNTSYWPESDYVIGSTNITFTALWIALYSVTYSEGLGTGLPPSDSVSYQTGDTFRVLDDPGLERANFSFSGWSDGTTTYQPGASYTVGTSNITLTAQWLQNAAPASTPATVTGPAPSVFKSLTSPKISRDLTHYTCTNGSYLFMRNGSAEEPPKITSQKFFLMQNGQSADSLESLQVEVKFEVKAAYINSTLSCAVEVRQENVISNFSSLDAKLISEATQIRKVELQRLDAKFFTDRTAAYAKKDSEFLRIEELRSAEIAAAKSPEDELLISAKYRAAFTAASTLWKQEIEKATSDRDTGRQDAQITYLDSLEKSGVSIYPRVTATVVIPKPIPAPGNSQSATTNPQPSAQMKKVGTAYMASGSYLLSAESKKSLRAVARKINASGVKTILVYGHSDSKGGVNNTVLSQNRAKAVANYLRPLLNVKRISVGWYSSRKPARAGTSARDLALNRRVEIYTR
jgi:uncharacterized repeat protein (TIGR02543 family)